MSSEVEVLDVLSETVVDCPRESVAAYASDPANAPAWYVNIASAEWLTPPPLAIGTRVAFVARFLGRPLSYTYEIVDYEPGRRLVMRTSEGPFPMETTYEWSDHPQGARMTLRNRGMPVGFSKLIAPFMALAVRSANRKDLAELKAVLEAECRSV